MAHFSLSKRIWYAVMAFGLSVWFTAVLIPPLRAQHASSPLPRSANGGTILINELDADQAGTDAGEFIELYDGGVGNTPLDGLVLVAFNGNNDQSYNLSPFTSGIDLDGFTTDANGYFVIGNTAVPGIDLTINGNTLQNGQDAVALYLGDGSDFLANTPVTTTNLIDALVYDTDDPDDPELLVLLNPGQPQVNENGGGDGTAHANQRCPNGGGGLRNTDHDVPRPPTPGAANDCLPNLHITKSGPTLAIPGETVTYTINYGNSGLTSAAAVLITDTLPTGLTYITDTSGLPCPTCATGSLVWSDEAVSAGSSSSFVLVTAVPPTISFGILLTNSASIASPDGDANPADNSDQWVTAVSPLDLRINKTGPIVAFGGEAVVYTLTLKNVGVATAANVRLTDTLPLSLTYVADSAPWTAVLTGNIITWDVGDLPANDLTTFNLTATASSNLVHGVILTNTVTASTTTNGDNPENNTAVHATTFYPLVPIATARAANDGDLLGIAGQVIYTPGTYHPNGWGIQDASGGIAVFYNPPPLLNLGDRVQLVATRDTFQNEEEMAAPVLHFAHRGPGPEVTPLPFSTGQIADGSSEGWLVVITGTVSNLLCPAQFYLDDGSGAALVYVDADTGIDLCGGGLHNGMTAVVTGFSTQYQDEFEIKPRHPADVIFTGNAPTISKDAPVRVGPGQLFTYTIQVANTVGYTLTSLVITDAVPALADFAYALDGGTYAGGVVSWARPSLPHQSSVTVRFVVTATQNTAVITNQSYAVTAANFATPTVGSPVSTLVVSGTLAIHHIQGTRHYSLLAGEVVTGVQGVVTAVSGSGFFLQDPHPDADEATSEGIFVYMAGTPAVTIGDLISVTGTVDEFTSGGVSSGNLSGTELRNVTIDLLATGQPLPAPIIVGGDGRLPPHQIIDNDSNGDVNLTPEFDPAEDGIDFYESLEGMLVQVNEAVVVGSTHFNEVIVVGDGGVNGGLFSPRGALVVRADDFNPERIFIDDTLIPLSGDYEVGDAFTAPITGVLDYSFGNFKLLNVNPLPATTSGGLTAETTSSGSGANQLTMATFNVENLDARDDPARFEALAAIMLDNLNAPDIIALVEVQDNNGPVDDGVVDASETYEMLIGAIIDAGGPVYDFRDIAPENNEDGGEPGGNIRVGFLFQPGRVMFVDRPGGTAVLTTTVSLGSAGVELSASPGRVAPQHPAFAGSRKPLAAEFVFNGYTLILIANHFNSKGGDGPLFGRYQPPPLVSEARRVAQAQVVHDFVQEILHLDAQAHVVVLGDLNDFPFSPPLQTLQDGVLTNLITTLPESERYTYLFEGNAQVLDHILVSQNLMTYTAVTADIVHVNAEFPLDEQASDHEPVVAQFTMPPLAAAFSSNSPVRLGELSTFMNQSVGANAYEWNFGDGRGMSTAVNPNYWYTAVGTYTVILTATNELGRAVFTATYVVEPPGYNMYLPLVVKPDTAHKPLPVIRNPFTDYGLPITAPYSTGTCWDFFSSSWASRRSRFHCWRKT